MYTCVVSIDQKNIYKNKKKKQEKEKNNILKKIEKKI